MFISNDVLNSVGALYENGSYRAIVNPRKQLYMEVPLEADSYPNYLIVNMDTGAIEFTVDQLPAVYEITDRLNQEVVRLRAANDVLNSVGRDLN